MVFSSLLFIFVYLPITLVLYYLARTHKSRNIILIIASLLFYAWGEPVWVILLIFSATVDYFNGLIIERFRGTGLDKLALISSVVINLGLLFVFKYSAMLFNSFYTVFHINKHFNGFMLPLGISFYTFQTLSYTIDVYRNKCRAQKRYLDFLLFVSLFHQLVAGPIVRYIDVARQIRRRRFSIAMASNGITRFIVGLSKKVIIANTAGQLAGNILILNNPNASVLGCWLGAFLYSIQIYFDFSGYSDMAIGLGKMFGFEYMENFNYPYISTSASEFWRRWHISLGSFFRDYLYVPLGGNKYMMYRNLFIVWFLTGLWHGASWNFVVWGLYYGVLIAIEKYFGKKYGIRFPKLIGWVYCVIITMLGWVIFYFSNLGDAIIYIGQMLGLGGLPFNNLETSIIFKNNIYFIILSMIASTPLVAGIARALKLHRTYLLLVSNAVLFIVSITMLLGQSYNPFLYFRF